MGWVRVQLGLRLSEARQGLGLGEVGLHQASTEPWRLRWGSQSQLRCCILHGCPRPVPWRLPQTPFVRWLRAQGVEVRRSGLREGC